MSFDYGPKRPNGQHTRHPGLPESLPVQQPIRDQYRHNTCGTLTTMPAHCARTYAQNPKFYGRTFCCACGDYFAVGQFVWPEDGNPINEPINSTS